MEEEEESVNMCIVCCGLPLEAGKDHKIVGEEKRKGQGGEACAMRWVGACVCGGEHKYYM